MTTLNGIIRSYGAAVRRMERDQQRQAREAAKRFKEQQRLKEIQNVKEAVSDWENYVKIIQSVHKNCTESIDWEQIENTKKPTEPILEKRNETLVQNKLDRFKPSFFVKVFGLTEKKIKRLLFQLEKAKEADKKKYHALYKSYLEELEDWQMLQEMSIGLKKGESESFKKALLYFEPFSDLGELGTQINFSFEDNYIDIDLHVNGLDIIPDYELSQTSRGNLSKKKMPKVRYNELYQDHICSASIRVAREVFAYLPIQFARINAMAELVNTRTGHLEEQPILSVIFTSQTIKSLNLEKIDPSDCIRNFVHQMNFSRTRGFSVIEKVVLEK